MTVERPHLLNEPLLTVREAAQLLSVSTRTVYTLIENGQLPGFRVGGQLRLSRAALDRWLAGQETMSNYFHTKEPT